MAAFLYGFGEYGQAIQRKCYYIQNQLFIVQDVISVFVIYNMYYIVSSSILKNNYNVKVALVNSVLLSFVMLVIVYITMMLSVIYKKPIFAAITSLLIVVFAPHTVFGAVTNDYTVIFRRNKNKGL
ncbi:MAG: hypothetical protein ACLUR5_01205 [Eubacterium ventriosum]